MSSCIGVDTFITEFTVTLGSFDDVKNIFDYMEKTIKAYGWVTKTDILDYLGAASSYTDSKKGWGNTNSMVIEKVENGYKLKFPKPTLTNKPDVVDEELDAKSEKMIFNGTVNTTVFNLYNSVILGYHVKDIRKVGKKVTDIDLDNNTTIRIYIQSDTKWQITSFVTE